MSDQGALFDVPQVDGRPDWLRRIHEEEAARDAAIARAGDNAATWVERAEAAVCRLAGMRGEFTTDEVWAELGDDAPPEPRAMGAVMRALAGVGVIEATDRTRESVRPGCHRRPVRVWRSLPVCEGCDGGGCSVCAGGG